MIFWNRGYKDKWFIWQQGLESFVMIIDGVMNLILLPTKYQTVLYSNYLRWLLKKQMTKRIKTTTVK